MKKSHRKNLISLIAVFAIFCIGYATFSFAAPSHGVKYTPHNLSTTNVLGAQAHKDPPDWLAGQFKSGGANPETEICVFCHTPHNSAAGQTFLWNRTNEATTFVLYTGSPTLDFTTSPAEPSDISKMCLSCHDGVTALNAMANPRNVTMQLGWGGDQLGDIYYGEELGGFGWQVNIGEGDIPSAGAAEPDAYTAGTGGVLLNDHPISFVYAQSEADPTINASAGGSVGGLPLWWSDNGNPGYKVECVTCHDPHINYNPNMPTADASRAAYMPFLRKSNASSSLCFTCHNK